DKVGNVATSEKFIVKVDKIVPTIQVSGVPADWTEETVTVTAKFADTLSGIAKQQYRIDGGSWTNYTKPLVFAESGISTVEFKATDVAGNSSTSKKYVVKVDKEAPTISVSATPALDKWTRGSVTVTATFTDEFSGIDPETQQYSTDDGKTWKSCGVTSNVFTTVADENGTLLFRVEDNVGNRSIKEVTIDHIDRIAPVFDKVTPSTTDWTKDDVIITVAAHDPADKQGIASGLKSVQYSFDNKNWETVQGGTVAVDDNTVVYLRATDKAGNAQSTSITVSNIDKIAPSVKVSSEPSLSKWNNQFFTIWAELADNESGLDLGKCYYVDIDGGSHSCKPFEKLPPVTQNGTITVYAYDKAGNVTQKSVKIDHIDKEKPEITTTAEIQKGVVAEDGKKWTRDTVLVSATMKDKGPSGLASTEYRTAQTDPWTAYTNDAELTFSDNTTVFFRAADKAGNVTEKNFVVDCIDRIAPTIDCITQTTEAAAAVVTAQFTDFESGIKTKEYKFDGESFLAYDRNVTVNHNGRITFRAVDYVGNETYVSYDVTGIGTGPTISVDATPGSWTNGSVKISASAKAAKGIKSFEYSSDQKNWTKYTQPFTVLERGVVYFRATDKSGAVSTSNIDVLIDTVNPTISDITRDITAKTDGPVRVSAVFADALSGIAAREYRIDSGDWQTYSGSGVSVSANGTVYFRATDNAGNTKEASQVIDNIRGPKIQISANTTDWTHNDVTLKGTFTTETAGASVKSREYSLDGFLWKSCKNKEEITVKSNGTVYFRVTDSKGQRATNSYVVSNIDRVSPTATIKATSVHGDDWFSGKVKVTVSYRDELSGLDTCSYRINGGSKKNVSGGTKSRTVTFETKGGNKIQAEMRDRAGNSSKSTLTATLDTDETVRSAITTGASSSIRLKTLTVDDGTLTLGSKSTLKVTGALTLDDGMLNAKNGDFSAGSITVKDGDNVISGTVSAKELRVSGTATSLTVDKSQFDAMLKWSVFKSEGQLIAKGGTLKQANIKAFLANGDLANVEFTASKGITDLNNLTLSGKHAIVFSGGSGTSKNDKLVFDGSATVAFGKKDTAINFGKGTDTVSLNANANATLRSDLVNVSKLSIAGSKSYVKGDFADISFKSGATASVGDYARITTQKLDFSKGGNNKLAVGKSATFTAKSTIKFGSGKDTLSIGDQTKFTAKGKLSFGDGANQLSTGKSSTFDTGKYDISFGTGSDKLSTGNNSKFYTSTLKFGSGDDKLSVGKSALFSADEAIDFGKGNDTFSTGDSSSFSAGDGIVFGSGNDTLATGASSFFTTNDLLDFGDGNDKLSVGKSGTFDIYGAIDFGKGNDTLAAADKAEFSVSENISFGDGANQLTTGKSVRFDVGGKNSRKNLSFGSGNDKLSTGSSSKFYVAKIDFGSGTNQLAVGKSATFTAYDAVKFGGGKDTLSTGEKAKFTAKGKISFGNGTNQLSTGKSSTFDAGKYSVSFGSGNDKLSTGNYSKFHAMTLNFGAGDDKLAIGASGNFDIDGSIDFGKGNDQFSIGDNTDVTIGAFDMGSGTNSWTIGKKAVVTVWSLDVDSIDKFSMGKESVLYLGADSYDEAMRNKLFSKYEKQIGKLA
ncbi:MAG: hypothetical protein MJ016_00520, partial [Victivallaceae bacterium]|nr:hypothetical protein [Victivallaceae bacterium]